MTLFRNVCDRSGCLAPRSPAVAGLAAAECALCAYGSAAANQQLALNGVLDLLPAKNYLQQN